MVIRWTFSFSTFLLLFWGGTGAHQLITNLLVVPYVFTRLVSNLLHIEEC